MSLAARCPACRTAFRVVADQLRVSDGWVRCGRCGEVFNANDTLFDLRALAAPAPRADTAPASEPVATPPAEEAPLEPSRSDVADATVAEPGPIEAVNASPVEPILEPAATPAADATPEPTVEPEEPPAMPSAEPVWVEGSTPAEAAAPWPNVEAGEHEVGAQTIDGEPGLPPANDAAPPVIAPVDDAARDAVAPQAASTDERTEPSLAAEAAEAAPNGADATAAASVDVTTTAASADITTTAAAPEAEAPATPGFVREAERAERWQSPEMRALLGGAAVLLAGAALIQGLRGFHAPLTTAWPQARTWVEPLCRLAGCQVEPRRRLDALSVDGSSLVQLDGSALTRLSLVLRNRDRAEVLLPAIELTLTDVQGTVVARKVFAAGELGAPEAAIAGGAELALQGVLDTGGLPVVGYTIELFYP